MKVIVKAVLMDDQPNANQRTYPAHVLEAITKQLIVPVYSNVVLGADPMEENLIGGVIQFYTEQSPEGFTRLQVDCVFDSATPSFESFSAAFVLVPDGVGVVNDGVVSDYTLNCLALVPPENSAWPCAGIFEAKEHVESLPVQN